MSELPGQQSLRRWEKLCLFLSTLGLLAFMAWSEVRSCFMKQRHTDFTVYVRAAWAARVGLDMYQIADEHGWHYCYPPPFALLLMPLADPPPQVDRTGYPPFWFSAGLWIVISTVAPLWTVHVLARMVLPEAIPWTRRWVYARSIPFLFCIGGIGFTISHGQVNTVVAALAAGMLVAFVAQKRFVSGLWLSAATALKITPALLVIYPLLHRERKTLLGFAVGLVGLLLVFPAAFFGLRGAIGENLKVVHQVLAPGVGGQSAGDQTRAKELTNTVATDSSSFVSVIHAWRHPEPHWLRPPDADASTRLAHWIMSAIMVSVTAAFIWRYRTQGPAEQLLLLGSLMLVMLLASPVSHNHHFAMALPAICGLWLQGLQQRPGHFLPKRILFIPLLTWSFGTGILLFPGYVFLRLREFGLGTAVTVLLWGVALAAVARVAKTNAALKHDPSATTATLPRAA